jgi:4-alpha-glucanotransferase
MKNRSSGILIHITSLPSPFGIGDLGPDAYRFVDFLHDSGQTYWQVLPVNQTDMAHGNSPYSSISAFAGNPLLISPEQMVHDGFLKKEDISDVPNFPADTVDFAQVTAFKQNLFAIAYERFRKDSRYGEEFNKFCQDHGRWLNDFALFVVLKKEYGGAVWGDWPAGLRDRETEVLRNAEERHNETLGYIKFIQYLFFKQYAGLKEYCRNFNIQIIGDIPIYVNYDSPDVWKNHELFKLNHEKKPAFVSGVPPDYFSATGQLWGNPVYNWDELKKTGFHWWIERFEHNLFLFDVVRVDHFRGFISFWEVESGEKTAIRGQWTPAPAEDFFNTLLKRFPVLPVLAEDLGIITADVREIMRQYEFPGMKVLLFAFGGAPAKNPYIPHNHIKDCVVYTGTHDNNTVRGWFEKEAGKEEKENLFRYLGHKFPPEEISGEFLRLAMMSVANTIILPVQDILNLGAEARMNTPSTAIGNWNWRLSPDALTPQVTMKLKELTMFYGRI